MSKRRIVLMTDFGLADGSAAVLEGVILRINPDASVIHMTHQVPAFDILAGALLLKVNHMYFSEGTIFVCVVDPGVGTERLPIMFKAGPYSFIGPNNGLFTPILEQYHMDWIVTLENRAYQLPHPSATFHGRDIFAPVAAHFSKGMGSPTCYGRRLNVDALIRLEFPLLIERNLLTAGVIFVDSFGNLVTSITRRAFDAFVGSGEYTITAGRFEMTEVSRTFADIATGYLGALFGGDFGDHMTICAQEGSAAQKFSEVMQLPIYVKHK